MAAKGLIDRDSETSRGKRIAKERASKIHENVKTAMFIKGPTTNQFMTQVMTDFYSMKKPEALWYSRKEANRILPFEDMTSIEFYSNRSDASLFMYATNSKKRPNNLVVGRMFDWKCLDMIEFGIENFKSHADFGGELQTLGSKPMFILAGEAFSTEEVYKVAGNLFVDFFRGHVVDQINVAGLEHVIMLSVVDGIIHFSHYRVKLKKSGTHVPKVKLEEVGPSMDLSIRRSRLASQDLRRESLTLPGTLTPHKKRNISKSGLNETIGRLHIPDQQIDKIQTKKVKGLKRKHSNVEDEAPSSPKRSRSE